nr:MAG TPA: hypothetical protein [Caudoviricetes sp.]
MSVDNELISMFSPPMIEVAQYIICVSRETLKKMRTCFT